ncbi:MAG: hypothetical protein SFU53_13705 [Terrimicrobiaceae bacterium]|nr:hypothetical protein [Terrimicrobiaceae bacterium]
MTPDLWILATVFIFVMSFIGQLIHRTRRPWRVPLVAASGFAVCGLTQVVWPRVLASITESTQRAINR